ncbi:MAG: DUF4252 domain-containing protein [Saprospiraceae bacterium]|nr:DUF4252 domain-containing protein [Saprospiraceae bacterium]
MKKPLFLLALAALPFLCLAQSKAINDFYNKYSQDEHFLDIKLSGGLLNLVASKTDDEQDKRVIRKITALRALVLEEGHSVKKEDYTKLLRDAKADSFEELIKVRDGSDNIEILIREKGNAISHVLLLVNGKDNFVLLSLEGLLQFSDLNDIHIDIKGADFLRNLPERRKRRRA